MNDDSRPTPRCTAVLATDLDGTLIPLDGNEQNRADLEQLKQLLDECGTVLTFVTGRHLEIVEHAIRQHGLPQPDWIICDVGTSIYRKSPEGWTQETAYREHLDGLITLLPVDHLRHELAEVRGLTLQEQAKQGEFKLSYYVREDQLEDVTNRVEAVLDHRDAPWSLISSVDPFTRDGLIDLLPRGVSKAYAVEWWRQHCGFEREHVVFAGDSGNDWAALIAGYRVILVRNAEGDLARRVEQFHAGQQWEGLLYLTDAPATSGVLEGCRAFGLIADDGADAAQTGC
jgi:maltooligosyltrehalose trehalohydrolase